MIGALLASAVLPAAAKPAMVGGAALATVGLLNMTEAGQRVKKATPNAITLTGYALGLWWCVGGPTWAGVASIVADELDGRIARVLGATSEVGSQLDSMADTALVPMALVRFGKASGLGAAALVAAPPIVLHQASTRAAGWRPPVGSWRAAIMAATMVIEAVKRR